MLKTVLNIYNLMIKELKTVLYDKGMIIFIIYVFSVAIYIGGTKTSIEINNGSIAFVDNDKSQLSKKIIDGFFKPRFNTPDIISYYDIDGKMDSGYYTFIVLIPDGFEKDVLSSKAPEIQVNIDATRMTQAGIGSGYVKNIINEEVQNFLNSNYENKINPELVIRYKYNPNLKGEWFGSINEIINNIVMISILLSAASLVREREHGTIEHLMVMPLKSFEIMFSKILAVCIIVLIGVSFSLWFIVETLLSIPISGSIPLYLFSTFLVLFATTSMGVFIGTIVKNMPQLGMVFILTILPLMMLSGTMSPFESMPLVIQYLMKLMPTSHFVELSQAILFRDAGFSIVWVQMLDIFIVGLVFFTFTLLIFKRSLGMDN
ncbi:multidrug resistance ABC transporter, permease protein [Aliarcobacter cibarius]|uniref:Multidrug resistance ABC transporter, permease protein n=1 Tax=Aliarcobacter cibarius TaxID=255507 RepID=A0A7L5JNZ0_9BACT|nr:ABC transporter permease [Aliarcobacter cibarius]QKJ26826.1 multidrug resistance ABC transporter, permease protein [Aliarcobacter cibarius]